MTINRRGTDDSDKIVLRLYTSYVTEHSPSRPWDDDEEEDRRLESEMSREAIEHVAERLEMDVEQVRAALERMGYPI